jgi:hypothetical protein
MILQNAETQFRETLGNNINPRCFHKTTLAYEQKKLFPQLVTAARANWKLKHHPNYLGTLLS